MARQKKESLERLADLLLLDDALAQGRVTSTKNRHGYGAYLKEHGILNAARESEIAAHEKTGFTPEQLDSLTGGADRQTRERYKKED